MKEDPIKSPVSVFHLAARSLRAVKEFSYNSDGKPNVTHPQVIYQRCRLMLNIPGHGVIIAKGDGQSQFSEKKAREEAERAAALHALAEMHAAGLLEVAFANKKLAGQTVKAEKGGIVNAFDYAARYNCLLDYSSRVGVGDFWHVQIKMPEHDINVCAYHKDLAGAEMLASHEFKKQAEAYHRREGTTPFALKDPKVLNAQNAEKFLLHAQKAGKPPVTIQLSGQKHTFTTAQAMRGKMPLGPSLTVAQGGTRDASKLARLIAAQVLVKEEPQLLESFQAQLGGREKAAPVFMKLNETTLYKIRSFMKAADFSNADRQTAIAKEPERDGLPRIFKRTPLLSGEQLTERSRMLQNQMASYLSRPDLEQLRRTRSGLPMSQYAEQVREIVRNNIYCIIVGATGSGKTTQVPQILLDEAIQEGNGASCNVVCTQPRRIAATSVAARVAAERAEKLQDTVGYHVRFDVKLPKPSGSITFATTGILLAQLQNSPDEVYDRVSHLVIDEVHERDIMIDFLLVILKKTMAQRVAQGQKVPRVILMSATIDAQRFSDYFKDSLPLEGSQTTDCPSLSVPGRTFPVKQRHLDDILTEFKDCYGHQAVKTMCSDKQTRDYLDAEKRHSLGTPATDAKPTSLIDWKATAAQRDEAGDSKDEALVPLALAATTVAHIAKTTTDGAVLVFLPGLQEIVKVDEYLRKSSPLGVQFGDEAQFKIFMLHSSIADQSSVFQALPPGCRKIILSTNIAETSVTIPDVQYVVDTGKSREKRYDQERRLTQLQCTWISKSNVKQRSGRAGRVQNGNYYALYTKSRFESMRALGLPELLRSELQEVCLDIKAQSLKMPVREFLAEAIEPPAAAAVDTALDGLKSLGALTAEEDLTPLGRVLAMLPVHPALGKMIILGIIFRCLEPMIILGAAAEERGLFVSPPGQTRAAEWARSKFAGHSRSDHIAVLTAFRTACEVDAAGSYYELRAFCDENFIHAGAFRSVRSTAGQIVDILSDVGLIERPGDLRGSLYGGAVLNQNSHSETLIKALLLAGLNPNLAVQKGLKTRGYRTRDEKFAMIHQSSLNSKPVAAVTHQLATYTSLALSSDGKLVSMRDTTFVTPLMALLFAGPISTGAPPYEDSIELDGWLPFEIRTYRGAQAAAAADLVRFRTCIDTMLGLAFAFLAQKKLLTRDSKRNMLVSQLSEILMLESGDRTMGRAGAHLPSRSLGYAAQGSRFWNLSNPRPRDGPTISSLKTNGGNGGWPSNRADQRATAPRAPRAARFY